MSRKLLCIDIRDEAVTAIRISSGLKTNRIESHCRIGFDQAPDDTENRLFWAIGKMVEETGASGASCILSLPPGDVAYRNVKLPFRERKKISQLLPFELESGLPSPVEEFTIDFAIVQKAEFTDIIAASVKTETLDELAGMLRHFGIKAGYITSAPVAEALWYARYGMAKSDGFLFLDVDDVCATACLVFSGKLHLARTFRLPRGNPEKRTERLKKEIRRITAAFETIYDDECQFDKILLSCTDSGDWEEQHARQIGQALHDALDVDVREVTLAEDGGFKNLQYPENDRFEKRLFNSALGLAGIEIGGIAPFNFSRDHFFIRKHLEENKTELVATGILFFMVFIMILGNVVVHARFLDHQVRQLDAGIAEIFRTTLPDQSMGNDPVSQIESEIERIRRQSALAGDAAEDIVNIDILNAISQSIPEDIDVLVTGMVRSDDHVTISGTIDGFNAVEEVKSQLETVAFFETITISSANMDSSINRVRFRIRADLAGL